MAIRLRRIGETLLATLAMVVGAIFLGGILYLGCRDTARRNACEDAGAVYVEGKCLKDVEVIKP